MQRATGNSVLAIFSAAVLTAWAAPDLGAQNLRGEYWNNTAATPNAPAVPAAAPSYTSNDAAIDYDDGGPTQFPGPPNPLDTFIVRWSGFVMGPTTGTVTFETFSDDGVRLTVGGTVLVNNWTGHSETLNSGTFAMQQGVWYPIELLYYEATGDARIRLRWSYGAQALQLIPPANQAQIVPTPAAPVITSSSAGDLQTTFNTISWSFGGTASNFTVYRSTTSGQQGTAIATPAGTVFTFTDPGANQYNTTYYYSVTATNGVEGPASAPQVALTPVPPPPRTKDHDEGLNDGNCACGSTARGAGAGIALLAAALLAAAFVRRATA
jgi:hypothetical protein